MIHYLNLQVILVFTLETLFNPVKTAWLFQNKILIDVIYSLQALKHTLISLKHKDKYYFNFNI